jgi:hypothetical protein
MKIAARIAFALVLGLTLPQSSAQEEPGQPPQSGPDNRFNPQPQRNPRYDSRMDRPLDNQPPRRHPDFNQRTPRQMDGPDSPRFNQPSRPGPEPMQLLQGLRLPPEQKEMLLRRLREVRTRSNELRENIAEVRRSLQEAACELKINDEAIHDRAQKLAKLEAELALTRGKFIRELRQKLPPEQFERLERILKNGLLAPRRPDQPGFQPDRRNPQPEQFGQPSPPSQDFNPPQNPRFQNDERRQNWKWKYKPGSPKADPETGMVKVPLKMKKQPLQPRNPPRDSWDE